MLMEGFLRGTWRLRDKSIEEDATLGDAGAYQWLTSLACIG